MLNIVDRLRVSFDHAQRGQLPPASVFDSRWPYAYLARHELPTIRSAGALFPTRLGRIDGATV